MRPAVTEESIALGRNGKRKGQDSQPLLKSAYSREGTYTHHTLQSELLYYK